MYNMEKPIHSTTTITLAFWKKGTTFDFFVTYKGMMKHFHLDEKRIKEIVIITSKILSLSLQILEVISILK